jgi:OHCU decarboxylase
MLAARPFASDQSVEASAAEIAKQLCRDDWLQAFAAHPRIGDADSLREKYSSTKQWASGEQSGIAEANDATIQELAQLNNDYVEKFGYIFIVCATGKSADEMLAILRDRLPNHPDAELLIAAQEQQKITLLRLRKLAPSIQ